MLYKTHNFKNEHVKFWPRILCYPVKTIPTRAYQEITKHRRRMGLP